MLCIIPGIPDSSNVADDQRILSLILNIKGENFRIVIETNFYVPWIKIITNYFFHSIINSLWTILIIHFAHNYHSTYCCFPILKLFLYLVEHAQHRITFPTFKKTWSIEIKCIKFTCSAWEGSQNKPITQIWCYSTNVCLAIHSILSTEKFPTIQIKIVKNSTVYEPWWFWC